MKKKLLSLLMCAAVLFGTFPAAVSAEETTEQNGAKFGVKRGDIVTYAGKDTPIEWRVLDPDKTNTDDDNGMLLLSEKTKVNATQDPDSLTGLKDECEKFYNDNFTDNNAVMKVSNDGDKPYKLNDPFKKNEYNGKLDNDTVFALSIEEALKLMPDTNERKFESDWWLRSTKIGTGEYIIGYGQDVSRFAKVQDDSNISSTSKKNETGTFLRPAINLDKTKLANLNGEPLLLPAGEFAASESLVSVGTASKWKLCDKNNDVKITKAYSKDNDRLYMLNLMVSTSLTEISDNDYISAIIVKKDGSISRYGRFEPEKRSVTTIPVMLSGVDLNNDSMYIFYENYNGAFSGSVGELTKICLKHKLTYTPDPSNSKQHIIGCSECSFTGTENHDISSYEGDEITHTGTCKLCGYKTTENHKYGQQYLNNDEQEFKCSVCGKHTFTAIMGDFEKSKAIIRNDEIDYKTLAFESCTTQGDPRNFLYVSADVESSSIFYDCTDNTAAVTFKTNHAIKVTGIKTAVPNFGTPEKRRQH